MHAHLADKAVLVHLPTLLSIRKTGSLSPHLLCVLQDHVAVPIEGLDACKQLAVVATGDEDLGSVADGGLEDGERSCGEFMLFDLSNLEFAGVELVNKLYNRHGEG
jgi:hypothetical protein